MSKPEEYYILGIWEALCSTDSFLLGTGNEQSFPYSKIKKFFQYQLKNSLSNLDKVFGGSSYSYLSGHYADVALQTLIDQDFVELLRDPYAESIFVVKSSINLRNYVQSLEVYDRFNRLDDDRKSWLHTAYKNIGKIEVVDQEKVAEVEESEAIDFSETEWEPLPIDRSSPEYEKAIEAWEEGLEKIEGDNGFAATEPETRNGIVETLRGGLKTVKEGSPSRAFIISGPIAAFKYVIKKFGDAVASLSAKEAVKAILAWLMQIWS